MNGEEDTKVGPGILPFSGRLSAEDETIFC